LGFNFSLLNYCFWLLLLWNWNGNLNWLGLDWLNFFRLYFGGFFDFLAASHWRKEKSRLSI
jgi:hypothetical protein